MTVIVAMKTPTGCVLGGDGRVTSDSSVLTDSFRKVRRYGSALVAVYGSDGRALEDLAEARARSFDDVLEYVRGRHAARADWGFVVYDALKHRLATLEANGSEYDHQCVATEGAGGALALGALSVLEHWQPAAAVRRAIRVACKHNSSCGGRVLVVSARRR